MAATLTTANSSIALTAERLYPQPVLLRGYAADNLFETAPVENGEFMMGIDGNMSMGYVHNLVPWTLTLNPDSLSLEVFENIYQYEQTNRDKLFVNLNVTLPSLGKRYSMTKGGVFSYRAPSAQRVLQPAVIELRFERMSFVRI